jgi:hypothetical protein
MSLVRSARTPTPILHTARWANRRASTDEALLSEFEAGQPKQKGTSEVTEPVSG